MEEEVKEQIREMVQSLKEARDTVVVVYIASIQARQVVIENPKKS